MEHEEKMRDKNFRYPERKFQEDEPRRLIFVFVSAASARHVDG